MCECVCVFLCRNKIKSCLGSRIFVLARSPKYRHFIAKSKKKIKIFQEKRDVKAKATKKIKLIIIIINR